MTTYLTNSAGGQMKETGLTYWKAPNAGATNSSGFNARGAGFRLASSGYWEPKESACWWSSILPSEGSTHAVHLDARYDDELLHESSNWRECGMSVRCIEN